MKTWEMIRELTENPDKRFRSSKSQTDSYVTVENGLIVWRGDLQYGQTVEIGFIDGRDKDYWKEVKKPVDFMTAFKAFREGKTIYSLRSNCNFKPHYVPSDDFFQKFHEEDIASDKWYIED